MCIEEKDVLQEELNFPTISIKEFKEKGYLQELNRRFLHPLGLALALKVDSIDCYSLDRIWDFRDDPEGMFYNLADSDQERIDRFEKNAEFIQSEFEKRMEVRFEKLGFETEPIPTNEWK